MSYVKPKPEQTTINGEKCVVLKHITDFNASRVFDCGQCFRFNEADGVIRLDKAVPSAAALEEVWDEGRRRTYAFRFISRFDVKVPEAKPGETVVLHVLCMPSPLTEEDDEPIFPEAVADPMIYVSLAVARLWQAERRLPASQSWMTDYYHLLRAVRSSGGHAAKRRFPRPFFR